MSDDLISRKAAKDAIASMKTVAHAPYGTINRLDALLRLSRLPSAERRGRWVDLKCDQCGQVDMSKPNYCPNCGAKMEV